MDAYVEANHVEANPAQSSTLLSISKKKFIAAIASIALVSAVATYCGVVFIHNSNGDSDNTKLEEASTTLHISGGSYPANVLHSIYENWPEGMPKAIDYRFCCPIPEHQFRYGCHTAAVHHHLQCQLCLSKGEPYKLSTISQTDFWSCKTQWGVQHGIMIANWINQNGAFSDETDQNWSSKLVDLCHDPWTKGSVDKGPLPCHCRRTETKNPLGPLSLDDRSVFPGFLDEPAFVGCKTVADSRDDAWQNEVQLMYELWKYGPLFVEGSVESFGTGNPENPSSRCVHKGSASGHNWAVVGYDATDPRNAYWIFSDSGSYFDRSKPNGGYGFSRMWNKCPDNYHFGSESIAEAGGHRYCIKGDKRGVCGGDTGCMPKSVVNKMIPK